MTEQRREEIERVIRLAALEIEPESLPALTAQLDRILEYVSQLQAVPKPDSAASKGNETRRPLRADEVHPSGLSHPLDVNAPAFRDGLFVVPKLGAMEQE